ncbi:MAG: tRNA 2-thiocytidine(32) synthetase TtcA, partial [Mesorhizobium sp.]
MNMLPDHKSLEPIDDETDGGFHPLFRDVPSS